MLGNVYLVTLIIIISMINIYYCEYDFLINLNYKVSKFI